MNVLFKVEYYHQDSDSKDLESFGGYKTLGRALSVKNNEESLYEWKNHIINDVKLRKEDYITSIIKRVIINYRIIPAGWVKPTPEKLALVNKEYGTSKNMEKIFLGFNIPNNMNYKSWGIVLTDLNNFLIIQDNFKNIRYLIKYIYNSKKILNYVLITLEDINSNKTLLNFTDAIYNNNIFKRFIDHFNHEYYYSVSLQKDNKEIVKIIEKKCSIISSISSEKELKFKTITLDIETMQIDKKLIPFCACFYDGQKINSFYLTDYKDSQEMLLDLIESLLKPKFSGYNVYVHNLSGFDGIFLFKLFCKLTQANFQLLKKDKFITNLIPIYNINNGKMINLKFNFSPINNKKTLKYNLSFKDSLLLLPTSLEKLANSFIAVRTQDLESANGSCENKRGANGSRGKTIFPYNFLNDRFNAAIDLKYIGKIPDYKYFDTLKVLLKDYAKYVLSFGVSYYDNNKYSKRKRKLYSSSEALGFWNLRDEIIKYCLNDCIILFQVMESYNKLIFEQFKLNIHDYPTLPSLALAIFRSNYLKNNLIPQINGQIYDDIRNSYFGGHTDLYEPTGENVKIYDVNGLYPSEMRQFMPCAFQHKIAIYPKNSYFIKEFEGDISLIAGVEKDAYGFFYVEVTCPDNLKHPILPVKFKFPDGETRSIYPTGTWKGVYYSEELKNASKLGYTYKVIRGYLFNKQEIFNNYVLDLYNLRLQYSVDHPMNLIAKLLKNSLYGRFGMKQILFETIIIDESEYQKYDNSGIILNRIELSKTKSMIIYIDANKYLATKEGILLGGQRSVGSFQKNSNKNNISIPIAAAITANGRIFMSKFKNNINLFYTDTDSIYTDTDLSLTYPELIGTKLGQLKLEHEFKEIVFLAPKVYSGITTWPKPQEISKIKGYKNQVSLKNFKQLLLKNEKLELMQVKT